jgi:hypothetical protein
LGIMGARGDIALGKATKRRRHEIAIVVAFEPQLPESEVEALEDDLIDLLIASARQPGIKDRGQDERAGSQEDAVRERGDGR